MSRFAWMVAVVGCAAFMACYKPSFRDCAIACDSPNACPSGLTCDTSMHMCTSGTSCSGVIDAPMNGSDGSGSGSGSGSGCYAFTPTNFDPCTIPAATGSLDVGAGANTPINTASCSLYTFNNQRVCLLHYTSVTVVGTVTINGAIPVIIVSDTDITVAGTITEAPANMTTGSCNTSAPADGGNEGAGGGGGGYGGTGGNGGSGTVAPGASGGSAFGMQSLEPLVLGCPGGRGANTSSSAIGGRGGYGGGALELSAQGQLQISGAISMNGEGGVGGQVVLGGTTTGAGGGGGGTGGSILLEASAVTITSTGQVCAIGGGGGQGGDIPALNSGAPGQTTPFCGPAHGGGTAGNAGTGGNGGAIASATSGAPNDPNYAGGGGGGAEGRIRVHSITAASISQSAPIAPLPYVQ